MALFIYIILMYFTLYVAINPMKNFEYYIYIFFIVKIHKHTPVYSYLIANNKWQILNFRDSFKDKITR